MGLSEAEKAHLKALIDADLPLPAAYRRHLCGEPAGVELVWPGKDAVPALDGETPTLRTVERYGAGEGWRDRLIFGDNRLVLRALLGGALRDEIAAAGGPRLIYLDPPFLTGSAFAAEVPVGETPPGGKARTVRVPAYDDGRVGGMAAYLDAMLARLRLMRELLADDGCLYLHCDHRLSGALRLLLDEVFGAERCVNEIVWHYGLGNPGGRRAFARKHDTILLYAKSPRYRFNRLRGEITPAMAAKYRHEDEGGRFLRSYGKKYYLQGGKPLDTVWTIPTLGATDAERLGYPTQKPEALLERIILASSDPGDLVADFCCGAGTLPAVAARLGRRWLGCDSSPLAIHTVRKRLLGAGFSGFDVLALDSWERPTPPLRYTAAIDAEASVTGENVQVALCGFTVTATDAPPAGGTLGVSDGQLVRLRRTPDGTVTEAVTTGWADWVESWAVQVVPADAPADAPFVPAWWTVRAGRDRTLPLVSGAIPVEASGSWRITIKVMDVLGSETGLSLTSLTPLDSG